MKPTKIRLSIIGDKGEECASRSYELGHEMEQNTLEDAVESMLDGIAQLNKPL